MLSLSCPLFLRKIAIKIIVPPLRALLSLILLLILNTGCSQLPFSQQQLISLLPGLSSEADFKINVTPLNNKGEYQVEGTTNFPDKSRITVAAIRYLRTDNELSTELDPEPIYSILDYKDVKVNQGKWQTTLGLWKISPDGQYQETWQLENPKLGLSVEPASEVTFLATLEPTTPLSAIEQQLAKQGIRLTSSLVSNAADGQNYVQTSVVEAQIPLPTGKTTPPQTRQQDINGGWGPQYRLLPKPPNINKPERISKPRTNAPLSPEQFLQ
ncbi:MAG: hypothetical protein F6K36_27365 [Symploca sp. SIO3C6]|uniref:Uncharacterized protein n=1 Tax=Symploca sp. SIO1C4 TaxID=2607765 RepID=A0A6B3N6S7_9CYAN|nr:hypothetical protein [Symploca sp. SIO3C6]NER28809.1 hypothetical protein [Symploca sp. SIO1C4]NET08491.1 hypothetical protein [Symploca sp. SIO2B6]